MMNDVILKEYEVRKTNKEKSRFIEYLKERLYKSGYDIENDITIETKWKGIFKTRNIVVGDPEQAEVFITAHYDTCAVIPFPNLMAPTNPILFISYQLFIAFLIIYIAILVAIPFGLISDNFWVSYYASLVTMILIIIQMMFGFKNKHTANDNTSGVIAITKILETLSQEQRKKVCVVYFDNEEKGLFGSEFFSKKHKKVVKNRLLINFDCVGDGNNIVSMAKNKAREDINYHLFIEALNSCSENFDVQYLCKKMKPMMFPSDQIYFKKGIGICALRKSPIGMYAARIHTPFDTRCREENIEFLVCAVKEFVEKMK